jgi:hypothetical protein
MNNMAPVSYCEHGIAKASCPMCRGAHRAPLVRLLWSLGVVLLLAACKCTATPSPVDPSPPCVGSGCNPLFPDAGASRDEFVTACAVLAGLGCPEGQRSDCAAVMQHSTTVTLVPTSCIAAAKTVDDARACGGFVKCR